MIPTERTIRAWRTLEFLLVTAGFSCLVAAVWADHFWQWILTGLIIGVAAAIVSDHADGLRNRQRLALNTRIIPMNRMGDAD